MVQQIFVIHGGDSFLTYRAYIDFLKNFEIDFSKESKKRWKDNLQEDLGEGYEVIKPRMPNQFNAKYLEWKIWFEKHFPIVRDDIILLGHSMGGVFLAKYLSEGKFPKKIKATFLVSAPFDTDEDERPINEFVLPSSLENFEKQSEKIFLYHSRDDPVVDFGEIAKYKKALTNSEVNVFEDRQHFDQERFPEIVEKIKSL